MAKQLDRWAGWKVTKRQKTIVLATRALRKASTSDPEGGEWALSTSQPSNCKKKEGLILLCHSMVELVVSWTVLWLVLSWVELAATCWATLCVTKYGCVCFCVTPLQWRGSSCWFPLKPPKKTHP